MDGFRWDYFDHVDMPGFAKMAKDGVKVDYLQPDYPSLSYPNYYSAMTGTVIETYLIFIIHFIVYCNVSGHYVLEMLINANMDAIFFTEIIIWPLN